MEFIIAFLIKNATNWEETFGFGLIQKGLIFLLVCASIVGIAHGTISGDVGKMVSDGIKDATSQVEKLKIAIGLQESGSDYSAVNPHSGALGKYQVMPENIPEWSVSALGYEITQEQFLKSPELQDKIVNHQFEKNLERNSDKPEEIQIKKAAATWYGGSWGEENYNNPTPQSFGGASYPSMDSYTKSVLEKYKKID